MKVSFEDTRKEETMNKRLLKSTMVAHGDTQVMLAEYLGITPFTLSKKINEKQKAGFTQPEISKIKEKYGLSPEDIDAIFFDLEVS